MVLFSVTMYTLFLIAIVHFASGRVWGSQYASNGFRWKARYAPIVLAFFLVSAFRPVIPDTDYFFYVELFNSISITGELPEYLIVKEIGYAGLNYLFSAINTPYYIFFGILSALTWSFYIAASGKYQFLLPLMLFFLICNGFLFWSFNGVRQSMAIMLFFFSFKYIFAEEKIKYVLVILFASLFHLSVLLVLPVYLVKNFKFQWRFWLVLYVASVFFIGQVYFVEQLKSLLINVSSVLPLFSEYEHYLVKDTFIVNLDKGNNSGLGALLRIFSVFFILYSSRKVLKQYSGLHIFYNLFLFSAVLNNLMFSVEAVSRFTIYFSIIFGLLMSVTVYVSRSLIQKYISIFFIAAYYSMFLVTIYRMLANYELERMWLNY